MSLSEPERNRVVTIRIQGDLEGTEVHGLLERVRTTVEQGGRACVLDLEAVPSLGGAGLHALFSAWRYLRRASGEIAICRPSPAIRKTLDLAGYLSLFPVFPNAAQAVAALGGGGNPQPLSETT